MKRISTLKNIINMSICWLILSMAPIVNAALVEADYLAPGDNLITIDTATGLEWLDIAVTGGYTYQQIASELAPGGQYEGFRYATTDEVISLFTAAGISEHFDAVTTQGPNISYLLSFIGVTLDLGTGERTAFITSDTTGLDPDNHWVARLFWLQDGLTGVDATFMNLSDTEILAHGGSALVRVSTVPLPGTYILMLSGVAAIRFISRSSRTLQI